MTIKPGFMAMAETWPHFDKPGEKKEHPIVVVGAIPGRDGLYMAMGVSHFNKSIYVDFDREYIPSAYDDNGGTLTDKDGDLKISRLQIRHRPPKTPSDPLLVEIVRFNRPNDPTVIYLQKHPPIALRKLSTINRDEWLELNCRIDNASGRNVSWNHKPGSGWTCTNRHMPSN